MNVEEITKRVVEIGGPIARKMGENYFAIFLEAGLPVPSGAERALVSTVMACGLVEMAIAVLLSPLADDPEVREWARCASSSRSEEEGGAEG